jgi:hypothetical protein
VKRVRFKFEIESQRKIEMARIQLHHISYNPEWKVELTRQMHTVVGTIQGTKASIEQYARISNFIHALTTEWNRIRAELDLGNIDLRIVKPGRSKPIERTKKNKRTDKKSNTDKTTRRATNNSRSGSKKRKR